MKLTTVRMYNLEFVLLSLHLQKMKVINDLEPSLIRYILIKNNKHQEIINKFAYFSTFKGPTTFVH